MIKASLLTTLIFACTCAYSQVFFEASEEFNQNRFIGITVGVSTAWSGSMIGLSQLWYKDISKSNFHTFDDNNEWLQMDKVGHFYTAHKINQLTTDLYIWTGLQKKKSLIVGTFVSVGYQTTLEFFDGNSKDWGFSWGDVGANTLGSLSYLTQQLIWDEERIIPKFSSLPTQFADIRPSVLGNNFTESFFKDYNGQTYWLSFSPGTFFENSSIPKWACLSIGYSIHDKLVGDESNYTDPITNIQYSEKREFLLSLDIDFSRLPIKKTWLKMIVRQFK